MSRARGTQHRAAAETLLFYIYYCSAWPVLSLRLKAKFEQKLTLTCLQDTCYKTQSRLSWNWAEISKGKEHAGAELDQLCIS